MLRINNKTWLSNRHFVIFATLFVFILPLSLPVSVSAQTADNEDINRAYEGLVWAPDGLEGGCNIGGAGVVTIDRIIQTLAFHESGGDPTAQNPRSTASGKYQYIDSSWARFTERYYPPGNAYAKAKLAPEALQDALAYIEYTDKFNTYEGDLFKIAVTHYIGTYDEDRLDTVPDGGNTLTPREYAEKFIENYNAGDGTDIPLYYQEAPEFNIWLAEVGGQATGTANIAACGGTTIDGLECPSELSPHPDPRYSDFYVQLPESEDGSYVFARDEPQKHYGTPELVCAIHTVSRVYEQTYGDSSTVYVGDLNASGHQTHNRGVAVDILAIGDVWAANHLTSNYSTEATIFFGKLWVDTGVLRQILWCEPGASDGGLSGNDGSMTAIRDYGASKGLDIEVDCVVNHHDHFHVDLLRELEGPFHEP